MPLKHDRVDVGADAPALPRETVSPEYLEIVLRYYEEEIEGEALFAGIAARQPEEAKREKMNLLAEIETYTAAAMRPLLTKYGLTPRSVAELHANGQGQADATEADWDKMIAQWYKIFPGYITDFENLEAMAPAEDLPALRVATAHEVVAVEFLNREIKNDPESTAPLRRFLQTGSA